MADAHGAMSAPERPKTHLEKDAQNGLCPNRFARSTKKWRGIARKEIPWFPTIDENKCIHCGLCYVTCGRTVFEMDDERRTSVVIEPYRCMVPATLKNSAAKRGINDS